VFQDKEDLLELYNAINGTDHQNPEELEITTLEDVIFMSMKNDKSFMISSTMNLYEHQSTVNPDMVGHTGVIPAAIKAVERVDGLVGDAVQAVKDMDGVLFICADHGNAEKMIDYETGEPHTAHTTNPVPFILVNADPKYTLREGGCLADIAPTLLNNAYSGRIVAWCDRHIVSPGVQYLRPSHPASLAVRYR
jgi:phosphopentomutase